MSLKDKLRRAYNAAREEWRTTPGSNWENILIAHMERVARDRARLKAAVLALPDREEWLGGQRFQYIQKGEVLELIEDEGRSP